MAGPSESARVDQERLTALTQQVITDAGAALTLPLARIGDRLGLFTALAGAGPATSGQLAERTGLAERYLREWLLAMAAAGYVTWEDGGEGDDGRSARYRLSPEQAEAFTDPDSAHYMAGLFQSFTAATRMADRLAEAFRTGEGFSWAEQHEDMFEGTERFFRPGYLAHLTGSWLPALTGIEERLVKGGRVADVGCGFGASTIIMAEAYPRSTFLGVDPHEPSIERARARAAAAGVDARVAFEAAAAADLDGAYDLIAFFDCVHDMPDPVGALSAVRPALVAGGRVMLVEPKSWDTVKEAINPLGRLLASSSLLVCLPSGLSAPPATGLGTQAGPSRTLRLAEEAGYSEARVANSTEFNLVYEFTP